MNKTYVTLGVSVGTADGVSVGTLRKQSGYVKVLPQQGMTGQSNLWLAPIDSRANKRPSNSREGDHMTGGQQDSGCDDGSLAEHH